MPASPGDSPPEKSIPILSYQSTALRSGKAVTVGEYPDSVYASIDSARLSEEGINNHVLNANVNGLGIPYSGFTSVELQVHETDAERAREILHTAEDDVEPDPSTPDAPVLDEDGQPMQLAVVAAFETARAMREAITLLASARIRAIPPKLVRRGDSPPGTGRRFLLRVEEDDLERAEATLKQAESEGGDDDEPRCPKCNSWRIYPVGRGMKMVLAFFGIGKWPAAQTECLACHYRGAPEEFGGN
ncbi:MAG TPA: DUF2007 domain-containing protein [Tepidisphaeraceae bacterium]|jgi:hypothetical protein|nr:DUF2007 domain-containing protein [Tepidisphaeraceae bacterium]